MIIVDDLLTETEVAKLLRLKNKHTLSVWRSTGRYPELRHIKIGRLVRYPRSYVEAVIQSGFISKLQKL